VLLIASGLFMFTLKSTQFNLEGFLMVLLASFIGFQRQTSLIITTEGNIMRSMHVFKHS